MAHEFIRQKQKQKVDTIFKYVKSLTPFAYSRQSQDEAFNNSQSNLRNSNKHMQSSMFVLSSKVFDVNLSCSKTKKKVQFSDQININERNQITQRNQQKLQSSKKIKSSVKEFSSKKQQKYIVKKQSQNPEQIRKGLSSLQSQIFRQFKIEQSKIQQKWYPRQYGFDRNTVNLQSSNYLPLSGRIKNSQNSGQLQNSQILSIQSKESRNQNLKNELPLNSNSKKDSVLSSRRSQSIKRPNQKSISTLDLMRSQSAQVISRKDSSTKPNLTPNYLNTSKRSEIFWQQQNKLMVQIFKKKLESKFKI